ncbi:MAG TPA: hypothetical protein VFI02_00980 [Armatimonadota bacterium]|nr:hypothetical protein [Armatimonadota bacterium]
MAGIADRNTLRLEGKLDDGRAVSCDSMFMTENRYGFAESPKPGTGGYGTILYANGPVYIGSRTGESPTKVAFPLVGHFEGGANLVHNGLNVSITHDEPEADKQAKRSSRVWELPTEGMRLTLQQEGMTLEEYQSRARQITILLSLADGTGVTWYRQLISWPKKGKQEIWGQWVGDDLGPGSCVAAFDIQPFLSQCIPAWDKWPEQKRHLARIAIGYINLTAHPYLDTRLLSMAQAWEMLANSWVPDPQQSEEEARLEALVKSAYKDWRKAHQGLDPNGSMMDRLSRWLRRSPALRKMSSLAGNLDLSKINLDLSELNRARNSVAHYGTLPRDLLVDIHTALDLLQAARFGLQLVLLRELGYSGRVQTATPNKERTFLPIGDFLLQD